MVRNWDAAALPRATIPRSANACSSIAGGSLDSTRNVIVAIPIWLAGGSSKVAVTRSACARNAACAPVASWLNSACGSTGPDSRGRGGIRPPRAIADPPSMAVVPARCGFRSAAASSIVHSRHSSPRIAAVPGCFRWPQTRTAEHSPVTRVAKC